MDIIITINIDNAAFGDNFENADNEVKRIVNRIDFDSLIREDYERPLIDVNGNRVGKVETA